MMNVCQRLISVVGLMAVMATGVMPALVMAEEATPYIAVPESLPAKADGAPESKPQAVENATDYILGAGDEISMKVYGEDDLSGQYLIGSTGVMTLPLIGNVQAAGLTIHALEDAVREKLSKGYLKDPHVGIQVVNYRPFFILGEVMKPGSYPYVNGMRVLTAIAIGGGYTYRADKGDIRIVHVNDPKKEEQDAKETDIVMPGDVVRVPERFF